MPADLPVAAALTTTVAPVLATQFVLPNVDKALATLTDFAGRLATALTVVGQNATAAVQPVPEQPATTQPITAKALPTIAPLVPASKAEPLASPVTVVAVAAATGPPPPELAGPSAMPAAAVGAAELVAPTKPAASAEPDRPTQSVRRSGNAPGKAASVVPQSINPELPLPPQQTASSVPNLPAPMPAIEVGALTPTAPPIPENRRHSVATGAITAGPPQHGIAEPLAPDGKTTQPTVPEPSLAEPVGRAAAPPSPAPIVPAPTTLPEPTVGPQPIAAEPLPAPAPARTAPAQRTPEAASPVAQLAPALVSLAHGSDGTQRLTLRLDPPELGQVHVRIDRLPDALARVEITVQRPETLTLLLRDQPQLQRALDQAGVPADGRSITFHVAEAAPSARPDTTPALYPNMSSTGQAGGDGSHTTYRQGNGQPHQDAGAQDDGDAEFVPMPLPSWVRVGVDITA